MTDHKEHKKKSEVKSDELKQLEQKYQKLEDSYKRAVADYANLNRRSEEDRTKIIRFASEVLVGKLIHVLDDLEKAQKHVKDKGIEKVIIKFKKILEDEGLEEINTEGQIFDPVLHEAIESTNGGNGEITATHRKGYMLSKKVIRPALVSVGNGNQS